MKQKNSKKKDRLSKVHYQMNLIKHDIDNDSDQLSSEDLNMEDDSGDKYLVICQKGCNKPIATREEYYEHECLDHLKIIMQEQRREIELLTQHIEEADVDIDHLLQEFDVTKDSQEKNIDELKERLMLVERDNDNLQERRKAKSKNYENKMEEQHDKLKRDSRASYINFMKTAEKDFTLFNSRLSQDFGKYREKLKEEVNTYDLKSKANLIAKEAERIAAGRSGRKSSMSRSRSASPIKLR